MMDLSNWYVLIVEDEVDAQDVLIPLLQQHDILVSTAFTAEDALETLYTTKRLPNVVIVDLALPKMDGWKFLQNMRADPQLSKVPAVAMTAFHSVHVAQDAQLPTNETQRDRRTPPGQPADHITVGEQTQRSRLGDAAAR